MSKEKLSKESIIWIASWAKGKEVTREDLYYCDNLYGHEDQREEVVEYMTEWEDYGEIAFREKYKDYSLY